MTRRQYTARLHTKDYPFSGDFSSLFLLPPQAARGELLSATAWDEHPIAYHRHLHLYHNNGPTVLEVTFEPPQGAIKRAEQARPGVDTTDYVGYVRYVWAPYDLMTMATALPLKGTSYRRPFAPDGPFEFVPPEHGYDYRTRARLQLPAALERVQDAADVLVRTLTQTRARRTEPLVLRFLYDTASRPPNRAPSAL